MRVKGVIFDCDGTLLDSMGIWQSLEIKIAQESGIALTEEERVVLNANTPRSNCALFSREIWNRRKSSRDTFVYG